jgi:hypothetical protein
MRCQRRGGRKRIIAPDGGEIVPTSKPQPDGTLVKALARAWCWQKLLHEAVYSSVSEIGETENTSKSYVSRSCASRFSPPILSNGSSTGGPTAALPQLLKPFRFSASGSATSLLSAVAEEKVCREGGHPAGGSAYISEASEQLVARGKAIMSRTPARTTRRHLLAAAALTLTEGLPTTADTEADAPMKHIVLLGDSVFDNAVYVAGGPDVIEQVRERLPAGWRATLRAVDGSVIGSVERQLHLLPPKPSHLVISVGGNDALRHAGVLDETTRSMADALDRLAGIRDQFAQEYAAMLNGVLGRGLPTAICTIYEPRFPDLRQRRLAATGLMVFNDCITREAFARGLSLIDLRLICDRDEDFANPIEPSVRGGAKIAAAIAALVTDQGGMQPSEVFARFKDMP